MTETTHIEFEPDWVSPPGDTIEDAMDELGMSQIELSERTGFSKKHINQLLKGKVTIIAETAIKLEAVFGDSVAFWLQREALYRESLARKRALDEAALQKSWLKDLPVSFIVKQGWVESYSHKGQQVLALLRFFGVASVEAWRDHTEKLSPAFRASPTYEKEIGPVATWLRAAELKSQQQRVATFDRIKLHQVLPCIRALTLESALERFVPKLTELCNQAGVALVIVPAPKGCPASGATWFPSPKRAVLALSLRHKSDDHLWFSLFHELGHLLLHSKKTRFLEGIEGLSSEAEAKADRFAQLQLIPDEKTFKLLASHPTLQKAQVSRFAAKIGIAPGIVVGRLQHDGKLPRSHMNDLKRRFEWTKLPG